MSDCSLKNVLKKQQKKGGKCGSIFSSINLQRRAGGMAWDGDEQSREALLYLFCLFLKTILARAAVSQNHQVHHPRETLQQRDGCLVLHV